MRAYPMRGVLMDISLGVLGRTACIAAIAMQPIDFSTRPTYPVKSKAWVETFALQL